jgi:hypothetical protein
MASRKSKRYGQGGSKHKHTPNLARPNGKAWKKFPKMFSAAKRRLVPAPA